MTDPLSAAGIAAASAAAGEVVKKIVSAKDGKTEDRLSSRRQKDLDMRPTTGYGRAIATRGARAAAMEALVAQLMRPVLWMVGLSAKDYFDGPFNADLAVHMKHIPESETMQPKASIAGPALEGLAYSLDEHALKNMYLELLASASDKRVAESVHPSFANIIKQLSSQEAECFKSIAPYLQVPTVNLRINNNSTGTYTRGTRHLLPTKVLPNGEWDENIPFYMDNWGRLGLVSFHSDAMISESDAYEWVKSHPAYLAAQEKISRIELLSNHPGDHRAVEPLHLGYKAGITTLTDLGRRFAGVVGIQCNDLPLGQ